MSQIKEKYRALCSAEESIPLFLQAAWLDRVAGEGNWNVSLIIKAGVIQAALPYIIKRKYKIFTIISQPTMTQHLGIWIKPIPDQKQSKKLSREKDLIQALVAGLPKTDGFVQNFGPDFKNWLPLYWDGYKQQTRYTYRLDRNGYDRLQENIKSSIRTDLKKARERFKLEVISSDDVASFVSLTRQMYKNKNMALPYSMDKFSKVIKQMMLEGKGALYLTIDEKQEVYSGAFIARDQNTAYYLAGATASNGLSTGSGTLCLYSAITSSFEQEDIKEFDFEGSMNESIERFFRSYGAYQVPYMRITKNNSWALNVIEKVKELIKALINKK